MAKASNDLIVPTIRIPGYRIEAEIGRGGVATVYLAIQQSLDRKVALKVMSPALAAEADYSERFEREGRTVAKFSHPNIVTIYDVGVANYQHYIAMEHLAGGSLKNQIGSPMDPEKALDITTQISDALGYAHEHGYVHRDVKPENILFRANGEAVLTDFGIAKSATSDTQYTRSGTIIGTPRYMSPEQAQGHPATEQSDIYALGVILFETLSGKPPYETAESIAVLYAHINDPIPTLPPSCDDLQNLINIMMAKDPLERAPDCATLSELIVLAKRELQQPTVTKRQSRALQLALQEKRKQRDETLGAANAPQSRANQRRRFAIGRFAAAASIVIGLAFGLAWLFGQYREAPTSINDQLTALTENDVGATLGETEPQPDAPSALAPDRVEFPMPIADQSTASTATMSADNADGNYATGLDTTSEIDAAMIGEQADIEAPLAENDVAAVEKAPPAAEREDHATVATTAVDDVMPAATSPEPDPDTPLVDVVEQGGSDTSGSLNDNTVSDVADRTVSGAANNANNIAVASADNVVPSRADNVLPSRADNAMATRADGVAAERVISDATDRAVSDADVAAAVERDRGAVAVTPAPVTPSLATTSSPVAPSLVAPAQPVLIADLANKSIEELLVVAENRAAEDSISTPPGDNAVDIYRYVIAQQPSNQRAITALEVIADDYYASAEKRFIQNEIASATVDIERGLNAQARHENLLALQNRVRERAQGDTAFKDAEAYYFGDGVALDFERAHRFYREAADLGNVDAMFGLAICLANGTGVARDESAAMQYFERAASFGHVESKFWAGLGYIFSEFVDHDSAAYWIKQAVNEDFTRAYRVLGWMFQLGVGVETSPKEAVKFGIKAMGERRESNAQRSKMVAEWNRLFEAAYDKARLAQAGGRRGGDNQSR